MPCATDLYLPIVNSSYEVEHKRAALAPIPSIWGHVAGNAGANPADTEFMNARLLEPLEDRIP